MSEVIGKSIDSGINDEGFWFKIDLNDVGYELIKGKLCLICTKHLPRQYKSRPRIYCSIKCYGIAQRKSQSKIDIVAVYRLIIGDIPAVTTKSERIQATDNLTNRGYSLSKIADLLHTTPRTISRYRQLIKEGETV